jgi:hypothetical protein
MARLHVSGCYPRLTRLVSRVREEETGRLWDTLYEALTPEQRVEFDLLLEVPEGPRISEMERWLRFLPDLGVS